MTRVVDSIKRSIILIFFSIIGILYFWLNSRYPDLNAKALMAHSGSIADTLSPWPLFQVQETDSFVKKVLLTSINWVNSNLKGMAFGIALGAAFLTLFTYLKLPNKPGRFRNTLYGFLLGTPLGVCVNCAAPVFKGILESKRIELAMATMLSSPTMNIIVLTMVFTFFPLYMGIIKILFTLCCIFIGIPLISKLLTHKKAEIKEPSSQNWLIRNPDITCAIANHESWLSAIKGTAIDYGKKLYFIAIRLIPLMLIAGLLGALLSHLLPSSIFESEVSQSTILLAALFGILLPVPIAFDIILVNAFYAQGLAEPIVLVLLCSLGIISLFSVMVIWTSISKQWATSLLAFCFTLSVLVGLGAETLHDKFYVQAKLEEFQAHRSSTTDKGIDLDNFKEVITDKANKNPIIFSKIKDTASSLIEQAPFSSSNSNHQNPFEQLEGSQLSLHNGFQYGIRDYTDPFWIGRGTAAGDFNQDGWQDIVFGSNQGFILYKNMGGFFQQLEITNNKLKQYIVFAVSFVDFDNNGWLDIFFTTFNHGNFVIFNTDGEFDFPNPKSIPNNNALLTVSPGFADIDHNHLLDVINGNMALGVVTGSHHLSKFRSNSIVFNGGTEFRDVPLEKTSGETMSTLVSDVNNDGKLDIYFANDFIVPDKLLLGTGAGFKVVKTNQTLSATPFFSMSTDSGDTDNDLQLDLLTSGTTVVADIVGSNDIDSITPAEYAVFKGDADTCTHIEDARFRNNCLTVRNSNYIDILDEKRNINFDKCYQLTNKTKQQSCLLAVMWHLVTQNPSIKDCHKHFAQDERLNTACEVLQSQTRRYSENDLRGAIPQNDQNILHRFDKTTQNFKKVSNFDHPGGWTWNSKIVDIDNDGWQDIINAEGAVRKSGYGWNVLMKNNNGQEFEQKQFSFNLSSDFGLFSFALIDLDADGDLDIIGNSAEGPVQVYKNHIANTQQSVAVSLIDRQGNSHGIGAKIIISYSNNAKQQVREIKASGGYMSFDPSIAYFGIGSHESIDNIEVIWPDQSKNLYLGPFSSNHHYRVTRR